MNIQISAIFTTNCLVYELFGNEKTQELWHILLNPYYLIVGKDQIG